MMKVSAVSRQERQERISLGGGVVREIVEWIEAYLIVGSLIFVFLVGVIYTLRGLSSLFFG